MRHKIITAFLVISALGVIASAFEDDEGKNDTGSNVSEVKLTVTPEPTAVPVQAEATTTPVQPEATIIPVQPEATSAPVQVDNFADVATEYTITTGYYTAGIDLPVGRCNIEAVEGSGNVSSSNLLEGGVNEMMGIEDDTEYYTKTFNGLKMDENVVLCISSRVTIKLIYTNITGGYTGREYNEAKAVELTSGNYVAGVDFPAGLYNVEAVSGAGNISSSNLIDGGINEMIGVEDGSGLYIQTFKNLELGDTVELVISSGVKVRLIPEK